MRTEEKLISNLSPERRKIIADMLVDRRTCTDKSLKAGKSRVLNNYVRHLNLKYCPTTEQLLHTDQFYTTKKNGRPIMTASVPALEMYHSGYRSEDSTGSDFHIIGQKVNRKAPKGKGGFGSPQAISDSLKNLLNGSWAVPVFKSNFKKVVKKTKNYFVRKGHIVKKAKDAKLIPNILAKDSIGLSEVYGRFSTARYRHKSDYERKGLILTLIRVDPLGFLVFNSRGGDGCKAKNLMKRVNLAVPDSYSYKDLSEMGKVGFTCDVDSFVDLPNLKQIAYRLKCKHDLPNYDL